MSLPSKAYVSVKHRSQLDNKYNPLGSCNVTCVAMTMSFFGIKGDNSEPQLEDQLYQKCLSAGWSRHDPYDLDKLFAWKAVPSIFTEKATVDQVKKHLASGKPCIFHGWFTRSGHIIECHGYDDSAYGGKGAFICHDPNGEWNASGYTFQEGAGVDVRYSYAMIKKICAADGDFWVHFVGAEKLP